MCLGHSLGPSFIPQTLTTTPSSTMLVESIICSPTPSYPYHIAAKRYSALHDSGTAYQRYGEYDKDLTLIFLHSTSFPKEIWEPTIENLLQEPNRWRTRIREAYAIDCPNHGVAAVLNDGLLGDCVGMMKFFIPPHRSSYLSRHSSCSGDEIVCRMRNAVSAERSDTEHTCGLFETKPRRNRPFSRWRGGVIPVHLFHSTVDG